VIVNGADNAQHSDALDMSRIGRVFIGFRRAAADFAAARWGEASRRSNTSDLRFSFSAADRSHRSDYTASEFYVSMDGLHQERAIRGNQADHLHSLL
jgi:hypothetical protein